MLKNAAVAAAVLLGSSAPAASAAAGFPEGNIPGCKGATPYINVCAKDTQRTAGTPKTSGKQASAKGGSKAKPKCSYKKLNPQPPASNLAWDGHKPDEGTVFQVNCPDSGRVGVVFVPNGGQAPAEPAVDPEVVAQEAVDQMLLKGPDIASPRAAGKYTVGVPMWLWVDQSPTTYGPNTATATAGAVTVTATAKVSSIRWDLGDGSDPVTCDGPGTPYKKSYGMKESPDCGHLFETPSKGEPGGKYQGTATATWTVQWQVNGGGEAGEFTEVRETDFAVSVGELKVLD